MKLMVLGDAQHGKDTVCAMFHDMYGLRHVSSSLFVAEKCVRPVLAALRTAEYPNGLVYPDLASCYADRVNQRPEWYNAIAAYNQHDPARLGRELFAEYDIYCGLRNIREYNALRSAGDFDFCLWVDRSEHVPPEPSTSMTITREVADFVIYNNGDMGQLLEEVKKAHRQAYLHIRGRAYEN